MVQAKTLRRSLNTPCAAPTELSPDSCLRASPVAKSKFSTKEGVPPSPAVRADLPQISSAAGGELIAQLVDVCAVLGCVVRPLVDHQVVGFPEMSQPRDVKDYAVALPLANSGEANGNGGEKFCPLEIPPTEIPGDPFSTRTIKSCNLLLSTLTEKTHASESRETPLYYTESQQKLTFRQANYVLLEC